MAIREKRFLCGKYLEVEIYPISKYEQKKSRSKKKKESRKEQKNLNDKNARKNLRRRIHANFDNRDLIVSLSYDAANLQIVKRLLFVIEIIILGELKTLGRGMDLMN